jgi:predicted transcriptional regulator
MQTREVTTKTIINCSPEANVSEAVQLMRNRNSGAYHAACHSGAGSPRHSSRRLQIVPQIRRRTLRTVSTHPDPR